MKKCTKCKNDYPKTTEYFFVNPRHKDGLRSHCKKCMATANKELRKKPIIPNTDENIRKVCVECGEEFPATTDYFFKGQGKYGVRNKCKPCFQKYVKSCMSEQAKQKALVYGRKYYAKNKKVHAERWQKYYQANAEHLKRKAKEYGKNNRDKIRILDTKRREDPQYRLSSNISRAIRRSLFEGSSKNGAHWEKLVGYTRKQLIRHIEKQFQEGMTWENYGDWHLDHVIPKSVFNFTSPAHDDFKRCWALKNLQSMWAKENMEKQATLEKPFQPRLALGA